MPAVLRVVVLAVVVVVIKLCNNTNYSYILNANSTKGSDAGGGGSCH